MARRYLPRSIEPLLKRAARQFPVVVLTGPRQTGKSTLLMHLFPHHLYVTLDDPVQRRAARQDPVQFVENLGDRAMIDEIQYAPELLPYLKIQADRHRGVNGRYLLTGSQVFPLMAGLSETLAGRAALFELLGFSWEELKGPLRTLSSAQCFAQLYRGFYPDPALHRVSPLLFYRSYLATYLERDIRQIRAVQDLTVFQGFLEHLAVRCGSLLDLTEISKETGISHTVARQWLALLESTRVVYLLRPYFRNITKRVIKAPKLYFTDTGLLAYLLKYTDSENMRNGPMAGFLFENMVVMEQLKRKFNRATPVELYFYRDSNKNEVDLLLDFGSSITAIEVKLTKTPRPDQASSLLRLPAHWPVTRRLLLSSSPEEFPVLHDVKALPWWRFTF